MKNFIVAFVCVFITGCVTHIPLDEQSPVVEYENEKCMTVSVIDNRDRVKDGKPPTFIGTAHGAFGIPMGWHVKPILAVEDGDKERDLAQWLQYRIVNGLGKKGWDVISLELDTVPDLNKVNGILQENSCKSMLVLQVNEWYFSINLNWVSAFNFDTNTDAIVYVENKGEVLFKNFSGRDVIDEVATDSHQNMIMRAYKDQLIEILSSPEVKNALVGYVNQSVASPSTN